MKKLLLFILYFSVQVMSADLAIDATMGSVNPTNDRTNFNLDFSAHVWYQWDQMVLLGAGSGVQQFGRAKQYPVLLSALIRLPIGGQMLPLVTGDWGYALGFNSEFIWRAGGGVDLKLGDDSSLFAVVGYQDNANSGSYLYSRAGILLEF